MSENSLDPEIAKWVSKFKECRRGSLNGKRHPHQPAVLLWFLESATSDNPRTIQWSDGKAKWRESIKIHKGAGSPESPITALVRGGVLESSAVISHSASAPAARQILKVNDPHIGLPELIWKSVVKDSSLKSKLLQIVNAEFD